MYCSLDIDFSLSQESGLKEVPCPF